MPRAKKATKASDERKVREVRKVSKVSKAITPKVSKVRKVSKAKLIAEVYDVSGRKQGTMNLPEGLFGQKVNKKLLAQAIHVYFENQSKHFASTKTRAEKRGGGAKPWRQKGTGRARAGSRRSPLWVGGGVAHGPKHRNIQLNLPTKMKRQALLSALSSKAKGGQIKIISNIEKIEPKTKILAALLSKLNVKGSSLFVISEKNQNIKLASRNIQKTSVDIVSNLNAFQIVKNQNLFISREVMGKLT